MKKAKASRHSARPSARKRPASSSSEILRGTFGPAPARRKEKVNPKWAKHYEKLMDLRDHLLGQREQLAKEVNEQTPRFSMHMADSGTDSFDRDFALSLLASEHNALFEIEQALNRIKNGTYGVCEMTGKPIPRARLDALPWTRFTVEAQRKIERDGTARRTRLADLGSMQDSGVAEPEESADAEEKAEGTQDNAS